MSSLETNVEAFRYVSFGSPEHLTQGDRKQRWASTHHWLTPSPIGKEFHNSLLHFICPFWPSCSCLRILRKLGEHPMFITLSHLYKQGDMLKSGTWYFLIELLLSLYEQTKNIILQFLHKTPRINSWYWISFWCNSYPIVNEVIIHHPRLTADIRKPAYCTLFTSKFLRNTNKAAQIYYIHKKHIDIKNYIWSMQIWIWVDLGGFLPVQYLFWKPRQRINLRFSRLSVYSDQLPRYRSCK